MAWYVYILECADDTLYTGVTTDMKRRLSEHNGTPPGKGAKYTAARRPVHVVYQKRCKNRSYAQKAEATLRKLSRSEKQELIKSVKIKSVTR
ncbi:MAG: GIY-YIG nuclease family protein [Candidatus Paceibacterota bacterium]